MIDKKKIGVVIPCYNTGSTAYKVISKLPNYIDQIVVIDDSCPENTGKILQKNIRNNKIKILFNKINMGVGASVIRGYRHLLKFDIDIFVKIDGDNQMDTKEMINLISPILSNQFNYTKGTRYMSKKSLKNLPFTRYFGNYLISYFSKITTGYWNIFDFLNGYTCMDRDFVKKILKFKIDKRFFFETHILIILNILHAKVKDIPVTIQYKNNKSNFKPLNEIKNFFFKNLKFFFIRVFEKYYRKNKNFIFFAMIFISSVINFILLLPNLFLYEEINTVLNVPIFFIILSIIFFFIYDYLDNPNI